jgi:hypothetical protein
LGSSIIRPEEVAVMRARNGYFTGQSIKISGGLDLIS